ncbi:MAG: hypothetical protein WAU58_09840 [Terriglobales bacterium]
MFFHEEDPVQRSHWIAILSYTASLAVGLAFWTGIVRGVQYLMR